MVDLSRNNPKALSLGALYVSTFLSGAWAMIIPTIPGLAREFGVSAGGAAQVITAFAFGKMVGTVIGGVLLDRKGTRFGLVGAAAVAAAASLGAVFAPWFLLLLAIGFVLGATDTLGAVAREIAAIDQAPSNQRGRIVSSLHGTHTVGAAFCPFLGGWLTELFNYKAAFIGYAVFSVMSVFLGMLVANSPGEAHGLSSAVGVAKGWGLVGLRERIGGLATLYREIRPDLRSTYSSIVFATMVNQSQRMIVQSMLPLYAVRYMHLSPSQVGMLFTISGVVIFAMMIPAGYLMDRVGRKWCTVPSTAIPALTFVLIPLTSSFIQLALLIGISGVAQGLSLGSLATSTYDVAPPHVRGRLQALRRTVAELGSGMAPLIGGYLANTFNPGVPFLVYAPLLLLSATLLLVVSKETLDR
ncbi:MAG: MFS transporter [Deltaproteobacteria bacterium]|nr:MFS transporter [Deltaproteobacteria bacterium]